MQGLERSLSGLVERKGDRRCGGEGRRTDAVRAFVEKGLGKHWEFGALRGLFSSCTWRLAFASQEELSKLTDDENLTSPMGRVEEYRYDAGGLGHRISMEDITGESAYAYDSLGRLKTATNGSGKVVEYVYDEGGEARRKHQYLYLQRQEPGGEASL